PELESVSHHMIREFVAHLHDSGLEKSSIARKLASLRSFFKYCLRQGLLKENPARLVPTPKLRKRIPSVISAEEMNGFLNQLARMAPAGTQNAGSQKTVRGKPQLEADSQASRARGPVGEPLLLGRDRALLELLYAAGLRVSELTGLNVTDV